MIKIINEDKMKKLIELQVEKDRERGEAFRTYKNKWKLNSAALQTLYEDNRYPTLYRMRKNSVREE